MKLSFLLISIGLLILSVTAFAAPVFRDGPQPDFEAQKGEVSAKLKKGAKVIDVRTQAEFDAGHFPGAVHIPVNELAGRLAEVGKKEQSLVVYCAAGRRAERAKNILLKAGFADVTNGGGLKHMPKPSSGKEK